MPEPMREQLIDPVCGMRMDPEEAPAVATYNGESFYFCSDTHKMEFERDPERYVAKAHQEEMGQA